MEFVVFGKTSIKAVILNCRETPLGQGPETTLLVDDTQNADKHLCCRLCITRTINMF